MPDELTLHILAEDVANGKRGDPSECPVARAIKREFGDVMGVHVSGAGKLYFKSISSGDQMFGSLELASFTQRFDRGTLPPNLPFPYAVTVKRLGDWLGDF